MSAPIICVPCVFFGEKQIARTEKTKINFTNRKIFLEEYINVLINELGTIRKSNIKFALKQNKSSKYE
tara:strand:+ start:1174 stop:1377 length:204 start_codon:yes stop_codon:yes gene_type:complete